MNKGMKIVLIVAGACIAAGLIIGLAGILFGGFSLNRDYSSFIEEETVGDTISLDSNCLETLRVNAGSATVTLHVTDGEPYVEYLFTSRGIFLGEKGVTVEQSGKTTSITERSIGAIFATAECEIGIWCAADDVNSLITDIASGDVHIDGFTFGEIDCDISSGNIYMENIVTGTLLSSISSGRGEFSAVTAATISCDIASGEIYMTDTQADSLSVEAASGDMELSGSFGGIDVDISSGDVSIDTSTMPDSVDCKALSGSIVLAMPESIKGFTLNYDKASGTIQSEFPLSGNIMDNNGTAVYAGGESTVKIKLSSGDIYLNVSEQK